MKVGLVTSTVMHVVILGFGLVSLQAPRAFEVAEVEALPVDIVPIESMTQIQEGDKKAPLTEKPAPKPTARPETVPEAQQIGDNSVDTAAPPQPESKPRPVETAALPEPSPQPAPNPEPKPEPQPAEPVVTQPEPVPATELKPEPQPRQEVKPDPVAEAIEEKQPEAEDAPLPDSAPAPQARPQPPRAQTAKAPERKDSETPAKKPAQQPESSDKKFDADQIAALLNKDTPSGGGAKRSTQEAALGGKRQNSEGKLSQGEMDALRNQFVGCWSIPAGAQGASDLRASIRFNVDPSGRLEGRPVVEASSGNQQFDESAVRAVQKCDQKGFVLPRDKPEIWAEIVVNFDPSDMF